MNKTEIIKILKETASKLDSIVDTVKNSHLPDEHLNIKNLRGKPAFFRRTKDGKQVYVKQSESEHIRYLSSKHYDRKLKAAAEKEKRQIDRCIGILLTDLDLSDVDKVAEKLPEAVRKNAILSELTSEGYARKWQEGNSVVKKRRTHKKDDYHKYKTLRGDYVGSKSEEIIADRLFARGVPYHYEIAFTPEATVNKSKPVYDDCGIITGYETLGFSPEAEDTLHPDFYVLNKRTMKAYYWEHLGRMDDPAYCLKNFNRFMRILDSGYIIGEDLLVTHEDSKHPLMTEKIDEIIDKYLI